MRRAALLLIPLFVLACDREPVAPDITPTFDDHAPPVESGIVLRGERFDAWTWADSETGLRVTIGFDVLEYCANVFDFELVPFQAAFLPSDRLLVREAGPMHAAVWGFTAFECDRFTSEQPVATGEVRFRTTDNDFSLTGRNNVNAYGVMANGVIGLTDGGTAMLAAHARFLIGEFGWRPTSLTVNLH